MLTRLTLTPITLLLTISVLLTASVPCQAQATEEKSSEKKTDHGKSKPAASDKDGWTPLFNGRNLDGWKVTNFGGEGEVRMEKGSVVITQGVDLSGITSTSKKLPKVNYEIELEAKRAEGNDFFVGLTFPVRDSSCSLILGGWGGGVCGLSSLDGMDASENETTGYTSFENGQWYKVRLKVTTDKIEAWLDKVQIVDVETKDRKIDVRFEVDLSKPLGLSTYQSTAHIRNARMRKLPAARNPGSAKATK